MYNKYSHFFDFFLRSTDDQILSKSEKRRKNYDYVYYVAIDTEWSPDDKCNNILSYQLATCSKNNYRNVIKYVHPGQRLTLAELVELGICSVHDGEIPASHDGQRTLVILIAHNLVAEWSSFEDRDQPHITKRLNLIRKTLVTGNHPIQLALQKRFPVDVQFADTMLLAPAGYASLAKLSSLIPELEKIAIPQRYKERMDLFLRDDPDGFERYAMRDSEACLHLFFLLQQSLNSLAFDCPDNRIERMFLTIGSAAVAGFLNRNPWFDGYRKELGLVKLAYDDLDEKEAEIRRKAEKFSPHWGLISRAYHGGRNEAYFVGDTAAFEDTRNKVWIDIDLMSCYPTALALCPKIDTAGDIREARFTYTIDDIVVAQLLEQGVTKKIVTGARQSLKISIATFEEYLQQNVSRAKTRTIIRQAATTVHDDIVERWRSLTNTTQLIPAFGLVRFTFPEGTQFPCLPVRHQVYGLVYPLTGETVAPACEIIQASEAGAKIEVLASVELPPVKSPSGEPTNFAQNHIGNLIEERQRYKQDRHSPSANVFDKLLKEFANSFYGKFAQGINARKTYSPQNGLTQPLSPSQITEPTVAALTTGLARTALSSILSAIENYNCGRTLQDRITVISATTDGICIGVPIHHGYTVESDFYVERKGLPILCSPTYKQVRDPANEPPPPSLEEVFQHFGIEDLLDQIKAAAPIQQIMSSRYRLTGSRDFLEVKHLVDRVVSIKTRGQIGILASGAVTMLARFGHKPPLSEFIKDPEEYTRVIEAGGVIRNTKDAEWLMDQLDRIREGADDITSYSFFTLAGVRKILESRGEMDLTRLEQSRAFNADFDWKRRIVAADQPWTAPHHSLSEMVRFRSQMQKIRKQKRVARPQEVIHRTTMIGRRSRNRHGEAGNLVRQFLRGGLDPQCFWGRLQRDGKKRRTRQQISNVINDIWKEFNFSHRAWQVDDVKNARKQPLERGMILPDKALSSLLQRLCKAFNFDYVEVSQELFVSERHREERTDLIRAVCCAVLNAPRQGIDPFHRMQRAGKLPTRDELLDIFQPTITALDIALLAGAPFVAHQLSSAERPALIHLFHKVGLVRSEAEACAQALTQRGELRRGVKATTIPTNCLRHFAIALHQRDVYPLGPPPGARAVLMSFGLNGNEMEAIRQARFIPGVISNTPRNRQQLRLLAKAVAVDAEPFLLALVSR